MWQIRRGQIASISGALVGGSAGISAVNSLYAVGDTSNVAAFATTSITPTPNALLVIVASTGRSDTTDPGVATVTDTALLTWVSIGDYQYVSSGAQRNRIAAYAAKAAASGSTTITVTYAAGVTSGAVLEVFEVIGTDVANGTSQTVNVQSAVLQTPNTTGTALSLTLAAASNSKNRPFCVVVHGANEGVTPRTNWTEIADTTHASPSNALETQWRSDTFETAVSATWTTSVNYGAIAFEVKSS